MNIEKEMLYKEEEKVFKTPEKESLRLSFDEQLEKYLGSGNKIQFCAEGEMKGSPKNVGHKYQGRISSKIARDKASGQEN